MRKGIVSGMALRECCKNARKIRPTGRTIHIKFLVNLRRYRFQLLQQNARLQNLSTWDCKLHQDRLANPLWMLLEQALKGTELLGDAL
jgi:hypothetical protein